MFKIRLIAILLFEIQCLGTNSFAQNEINQEMKYTIKITNFYFGRKQHVTTLTDDSIKSEINYVKGQPKIQSRRLTLEEKKKIGSFLSNFPITKLKEQYVNTGVEDGTQIGFWIKAGETEKSIYVANIFQKDLADLVALIVTMLSNDYIGYNVESVPWTEE